jgi:cytochrome P450
MSATASPGFDLHDPGFLADPYPVFDQLRAAAPVWKAPFGRWLLTRYDDCNLLMRDRRFGKDYTDPEALKRRFGPTALEEPAVVELSYMKLMRDPPDHTRLRCLVTKAFTARRIESLRPRVREMAERLIDAAMPAGWMDAIRDLAFPLPMMVICELLAIPDRDRDRFIKGSVSGGRRQRRRTVHATQSRVQGLAAIGPVPNHRPGVPPPTPA